MSKKYYAIVGATNSGKNHFQQLVLKLYPNTDVNQVTKWMGGNGKYETRMDTQKKTHVHFIYIRATADTCVERMKLSGKIKEFELIANCSPLEEEYNVILAHMKRMVLRYEKKYYIPHEDVCKKNGYVSTIDGSESSVIVVENDAQGDEHLIERIHDIFGE